MHNGFYLELDELRKDDKDADFCFLENIPAGNTDTYSYLQGFCTAFAKCLNKKFGYPVHMLKNTDEELVHAYCVTKNKNGENIFIDVRGCTDDFYGEFIKEFEDLITLYPNGASNITTYDKYDRKILDERWMGGAMELITKYADYYSPEGIKRMK